MHCFLQDKVWKGFCAFSSSPGGIGSNTHFCRRTGYVAITCFFRSFLLRFDSDIWDSTQIWLRYLNKKTAVGASGLESEQNELVETQNSKAKPTARPRGIGAFLLARSRELARELDHMSREEIINLYTLHKRSKTNKKLTTPDLQKKKRCGLKRRDTGGACRPLLQGSLFFIWQGETSL